MAFRVNEGRVELLASAIRLEAANGAVKPRSRRELWKAIRRIAHEERVQRRQGKAARKPQRGS